MTTILVGPKYCKIQDENDTDFLSKLDKHLSFKYIGAEYTPAYKMFHWDGKEYLLSKKLTFMTGLLDYVKEFYNSNNKQLDIIDKRLPFVIGKEIDISNNLKKLNIVPYDYQNKSVELSLLNDRMIFKHATGSGKTLSIAMITAKLGLPTMIEVVSKDLLYQFHEFFSQVFDEKIGIVGDGLCDIQNITIASIQTLGRCLGMKKNEILLDEDAGKEEFEESNTAKILNYIKKVKVHHFDECHICAAKTIRNIYKAIEPEKIFGWSGTPVRDDGAQLLINSILGFNIDEVSASDLIKRGILAKPFIKFIYVKGHCHYKDNYPTVYNQHVVDNNYRNELIVKETNTLIAKGYQVLILFKTIKHGKKLFEMFDDRNIHCEFLTGNDTAKVRAKAKDNLLNKKSNLIIASQIYDLGVDIKTLNALVLTGSGKSLTKTLQRIGRVIRCAGEDKQFTAIIDLWDDVKYLKKHSLSRLEIYKTEPEFVIKIPKNIK